MSRTVGHAVNNRDYKINEAGGFFHVYNRGNAKEEIFRDSSDYAFLLNKFQQNIFPSEVNNRFFRPLQEGSFSIVAYCLMPNHFHFLIRQNGDIPISRLIGKICTGYSMGFNKKYDRVGHVFQDQYKQAHIVNTRYFHWLVAYIHQNPTVAGIARKPQEYQWSSYKEYESIDSDNHGLCDKKLLCELFPDMSEHLRFTADAEEIMRQSKEMGDILIDM